MNAGGSSNRYRNVEALYQRVLDLAPDVRADFLARECHDDPGLRGEIETLLKHYEAAGNTFLSPAFDNRPPSPADSIPLRIGQYEIIRLVGQGGMGVVFEARQENPRRSVAVKAIRPGIASPQSLRRFEHEAAVLGRLQHPGIAHVYEAGVADVVTASASSGAQPFFAMEFIQGVPLQQYARDAALDPRQRLELMVLICDAVEHAHQKGVIHRDLKPGNILITPNGQPKILDFGVARVTDSDVQMSTMHTQAAQVVGTLPYMSPEQVSGQSDRLDTRSDVYSLGVILYELLAGRLPHDLADKHIPAAARIITEETPLALGSANRACRGDVATIVHKALEIDPARRYPSVHALAEDIRRFLQREPIAARPASAIYQMRRFAQRNKAFVGGVAATFLTLVVGVIGTTYGMLQMIRQRDETDLQSRIVQAANDFLTDDLLELADPNYQPDRDITLREVLDRAAAKIDGRFPDSPVLEANLRKTIGRAYSHLGVANQAEPQFMRAFELYLAARGERDEDTLMCRMELASLFVDRGQFEKAEQAYAELLPIQREFLGPQHKQTIASLHNLGNIYVQQSRFEKAEPILREALDLRLLVLGENNSNTALTMDLLGVMLMYTGRADQGVKQLERALDIDLRVVGESHPHTLQTMSNLGVGYAMLKQFDKAEESLVRTLELDRRILGEEHRSTLQVASQLAAVYGFQKNPKREPLLRQTLEVQRRVMGENHINTLSTALNLAKAAYDRGDFESSEAQYRDLAERANANFPTHWMTSAAFLMHGRCLTALDRFDEAEQSLTESHAIGERVLGPAHDRTRQAVDALIALYSRWEKPELVAHWRARSAASQPASPPNSSKSDRGQ